MAPARCYLLELPKELRTEIWKCLVKPRELDITCFERHIVNYQQVRARPQSDFVCFKSPNLWPSILRTCRIIHDEAAPLLLQPDVLFLRPAGDVTHGHHQKQRAVSKARSFDLRLLRKIKKVQTVALVLPSYGGNFGADCISNSRLVARSLRLEHIRHVKVELYDAPEPDSEVETSDLQELPAFDDLQTLLKFWGPLLPCKTLRLELWAEFEALVTVDERNDVLYHLGAWNRDAELVWSKSEEWYLENSDDDEEGTHSTLHHKPRWASRILT